jgi:hypothetical protein
MQKQQITDWLNSGDPDWHTGMALLSAFSTKRHLIRVLVAKGRTAKSMVRLRYELSRIVKAKIAVPVSKTGKPRQTPGTTLKTPKGLPIAGELTGDLYLDDLTARKNKCHRQAMALKHQLLYLSQPQRGESARRVLELITERDLLWRQIDYYEKFKIKAPDVLSPTDPSLLNAKKRRDNLRCSVSKLKKKIADVTKAKSKDRYETELALKLLEIADLDKQINF